MSTVEISQDALVFAVETLLESQKALVQTIQDQHAVICELTDELDLCSEIMDDLIDCEESCEDEPVFSTEENKKLKKKIVELKKGIATAEYVAGLRDSPPQEGAEEDECKRGTSRRT